MRVIHGWGDFSFSLPFPYIDWLVFSVGGWDGWCVGSFMDRGVIFR